MQVGDKVELVENVIRVSDSSGPLQAGERCRAVAVQFLRGGEVYVLGWNGRGLIVLYLTVFVVDPCVWRVRVVVGGISPMLCSLSDQA